VPIVKGNDGLKRAPFALFGTVSALLALLLVPSLLYDILGLFNVQDAADGPKWALIFVVVVFAALVFGGFFLAHRLFQLAARSPNIKSR